jgi:YggT family protein
LIDTFSGLYLLMFLLRILLQVARAEFYSPIPQLIVRITNPLVVPARRIIPSFRQFDLPTLVLLYVLQVAVILLLDVLSGFTRPIDSLLLLAAFTLLTMTIWTYLISILIYIVLSWVGQAYHPLAIFVGQLIAPLLRPARRILPPAGGLDLSPMIVSIFLVAGLIFVRDLQMLLA